MPAPCRCCRDSLGLQVAPVRFGTGDGAAQPGGRLVARGQGRQRPKQARVSVVRLSPFSRLPTSIVTPLAPAAAPSAFTVVYRMGCAADRCLTRGMHQIWANGLGEAKRQ